MRKEKRKRRALNADLLVLVGNNMETEESI